MGPEYARAVSTPSDPEGLHDTPHRNTTDPSSWQKPPSSRQASRGHLTAMVHLPNSPQPPVTKPAAPELAKQADMAGQSISQKQPVSAVAAAQQSDGLSTHAERSSQAQQPSILAGSPAQKKLPPWLQSFHQVANKSAARPILLGPKSSSGAAVHSIQSSITSHSSSTSKHGVRPSLTGLLQKQSAPLTGSLAMKSAVIKPPFKAPPPVRTLIRNHQPAVASSPALVKNFGGPALAPTTAPALSPTLSTPIRLPLGASFTAERTPLPASTKGIVRSLDNKGTGATQSTAGLPAAANGLLPLGPGQTMPAEPGPHQGNPAVKKGTTPVVPAIVAKEQPTKHAVIAAAQTAEALPDQVTSGGATAGRASAVAAAIQSSPVMQGAESSLPATTPWTSTSLAGGLMSNMKRLEAVHFSP